jgi:glutathione synthase/RimK-type ligase-like ATP-grasp enzyme
MKLGLWIPSRSDLTAPISIEVPGKIDQRICKELLNYLESQEVIFSEQLDFRNAYVKDGQVFLEQRCLSDLNTFIWFSEIDRNPGSHHLEILRLLSLTTKVINSYEFVSQGLDKFRAFSLLHQHKIPVSEFLLVNPRNLTEIDLSQMGTSFLLKPRRGGFGKGIVKIDSPSQLRDIVDYVSAEAHESFYIEKYYENDMSCWTGLTIINGNVLYGYRKKPERIADWKPYDRNRVGGGVNLVIPDDEQKNIAKRVYEIMQPNFFGLDIIKTKEGYKVVDINCFPGLYYDFLHDLKIDFPKVFFSALNL